MTKRQYSDEFKEQILKECQKTGNVALAARRHEISPNTIHTWVKNNVKEAQLNLCQKPKMLAIKLWKNNLKK
ncbi:MAG: hypothetical protein PWP07_2122 [Epulopiscium sp.]|jgi:transposase-like protein|nr:hypothetical protein [Candidatus Epulonipiscium sp.]MDK2822850.1 hypothetical protein [Clostridia bacterium]MDN5322836.1 hypothetical protein [Clostridia bacterium]